MPELPEIQTIVDDLNKKILGLKITNFWCDWKKMIKLPKNSNSFLTQIKNRKIEKIARKGKNILIYLSGGKIILIHQKMTGHLLVSPWKNEKVNNYIHLIFYLNNGWQLALSDLRKFAKVLAGDQKIIENLPELKNLGPNPLKITSKEFKNILEKRKGKIKQVLMDQEVFSGIGNIYSDEILWEAGIHPLEKVEKLSAADFKKIYKATIKILNKVLKLRGTSVSDYRDTAGKAGGYDKIRLVYQREGEKCGRRDGGVITRIKIGSRSVHFCPKHQIML